MKKARTRQAAYYHEKWLTYSLSRRTQKHLLAFIHRRSMGSAFHYLFFQDLENDSSIQVRLEWEPEDRFLKLLRMWVKQLDVMLLPQKGAGAGAGYSTSDPTTCLWPGSSSEPPRLETVSWLHPVWHWPWKPSKEWPANWISLFLFYSSFDFQISILKKYTVSVIKS